MIVVDASVWVNYLANWLADSSDFQERIESDRCLAPPHIDMEIGSALFRLERAKKLRSGAAAGLIEDFTQFPIERIHTAQDAIGAAEVIDNASYADAWYVALARRVGCPILTADTGMATAAKIHGVEVVEI